MTKIRKCFPIVSTNVVFEIGRNQIPQIVTRYQLDIPEFHVKSPSDYLASIYFPHEIHHSRESVRQSPYITIPLPFRQMIVTILSL